MRFLVTCHERGFLNGHDCWVYHRVQCTPLETIEEDDSVFRRRRRWWMLSMQWFAALLGLDLAAGILFLLNLGPRVEVVWVVSSMTEETPLF